VFIENYASISSIYSNKETFQIDSSLLRFNIDTNITKKYMIFLIKTNTKNGQIHSFF